MEFPLTSIYFLPAGHSFPTVRGEMPVRYEVFPLFTYSICYWEVYRRGEEQICNWGRFSLGESALGKEISGKIFQRKFYTWGIWQNYYTKFLLIVLHYLCQPNFACGKVPGELCWGYFPFTLISRKKITWKRAFPESSRKRLEIKVFFKWDYANDTFSTELSARNFTWRGIFS